jgi:Domain of unknown function (DUF4184)
MPLTTAHAAAAWPISRIAPKLPTAALVLGTMSPDFEYLLRLEARSDFSHTPLGLVAFCVPTSLVVWTVFEYLVRPAFLNLLPAGMGAALSRDASGSRLGWREVALAAAASLVGAATHVVWDAFTHQRGWAVPYLPVLATPAGLPFWPTLQWYRLLQHISTVVGSVVVAFWVLQSVARIAPQDRAFAPDQAKRGLRIAILISVASVLGGALNALRVWGSPIGRVLSFGAVGTMVGFVLAAVAFGLGRQQSERRA